MGILQGKKALILGLANERSIAWGITQAFAQEGASIGLTYANEAIQKRIEPLSEKINVDFITQVDVTVDQHFDNLRNLVKEKWGEVDILVHSLAFADTADLKERFCHTTRSGFSLACDISAYSLIALARALRELMKPGSSIMCMTYHGSQKVMKNYNVMGVAKAALEASARYLAEDLGPEGIRVNCISAGPVRTLASAGIPGFREILKHVEEKAPLRRNISLEDVAGTALYLASPYSASVTGQVLYVDSGYSIMAI